MAGMAIDVLGPVRVESASLHPRERAVLAALVVRRGIPLAPEDLAEAIWAGAERPATWNKQVQQAVARLRKALGADHIATTAAGYHLDADPDEIDAVRFESLIAQARRHHLDGEPGRAVDGYRRALALWRGRPYDELSAWPEAVAAGSDLEQLRVEAGEALLRARIDAGDALGVIPEAERLVRDEPLRESRWALLSLALYRSGRQADALATLRAARERLADELGVDAGSEIVELEQAILQHDDALDRTLSVAQTRADCPYRGLGTYQESDADDFFGREREIATATRRLDETGLLVVTGASGSGKSSLVRAGVVPSLRRRGRRIRTVGPGPTVVGEVQAAVDGRSDTDVVVVDQFEEILEADAAAAAEVASLLAAFVADDGRAIITVRSDYLDACAADPSLAPLMAEGVLVVPPMDSDDLRRVIEAPAAAAGLRLEPGLIELILRDSAGGPGILPHLSHALAETWARREGPVLTVAGYEATGGIAGAIAQSADRLYQRLDPADQDLCRSTLLRMVALAPDGLPVRRRLAAAPLRAEAAQANVFEELAHARLVSVEGDSVVLAHEALTRAWPRFRGWLQEGAEALAVLGHVESGAAVWDAGGRSDDDLARGARLQAMLEIRDELDLRLTATEAAFIDASAARDLSERRALEAAADAERRQNRRLRFAITGVVGMLAIALVAGGLAVRSAVGESAAAEDARIEVLAGASAALRSTDRVVAALVAAETYRRWPDDSRAKSALFGMLASRDGAITTTPIEGTEERVSSTVIPGTSTALVIREHEFVDIRDIHTGEVLRTLDVELPRASGITRPFVRISEDGSIAVVQDGVALSTVDENGIPDWINAWTVLDLDRGEVIGDPVLLELGISDYALSPDGRHVAFTPWDGGVVLIDTQTQQVMVDPSHGGTGARELGQPATVGFSPDGAMLVSTNAGQLTTFDPERFEVVDDASVAPQYGAAVVMSLKVLQDTSVPPEYGNKKLVALEDGTVIVAGDRGLVAVGPDGEMLWQQDGDIAGPCAFLTVVPERDSLFCGDGRGHVIERHLATGKETGLATDYQIGASGELVYDYELDQLHFMSAHAAAIGHWRLDGSPEGSTMLAPGFELTEGLDPSGRYALAVPSGSVFYEPIVQSALDVETGTAAASAEAIIAFWAGSGIFRTVTSEFENFYIDVPTGRSTPAKSHDHDVSNEGSWAWPQASKDGELGLIASCCTGTVITVDPTTGEELGTTYEFAGFVFSMTTTPDGSHLIGTAVDEDEGLYQLAVFDTATGELLAEHLGTGDVATVAGDDRILLAGPDVITEYDLALNPLRELEAPTGSIDRLAVSDDGDTLLVTTWDWTVAVYDLESWTMVGEPIQAASIDSGFAATLHPSGEWFLMNTDAGIVRVELDADAWFEDVCTIAGRNFTEREWETHFGAIGEYRETCDFPTA